MKQEAIRKLRHRILAGLLCFSIVFAGQPNGLKASGLLDTDMKEDFNTEEATEIDAGDSQNLTLTEEPEEDTTEDFNALTEEVFSDEQNEEGTEECFSEHDETENTEDIEEEPSLLEDNDPVEPQTDTIHQHSVSTDCSVSAGEQVNFTELPLDFTGGTLAEGNYYLSEDVTLNSSINISSGTVKLCLNGHTLRYGGSGKSSVIQVTANAALDICDCITSGQISGGTDSCIKVNQGTLHLYGGTLTDSTCSSGGGVWNYKGTFNMFGGAVTGNTVTSQGGGVLNNGSFEMSGGLISGNTAHQGGGIYNDANGIVKIYGGSITDNTVLSSTSASAGGGIYNSGTLYIKGGSISTNKAASSNTNSTGGTGGGVYNGYNAEVEMSDGIITGNSAAQGGGIHLASGTMQMTGGNISNNTATGSGGGILNDRTIQMSGGIITGNYAANGGGIMNRSILKLSGGSISNNTAASVCAGIENRRTLEISGNPIVRNNTVDSKESNVRVSIYTSGDNSPLTITAPLTDGADIGITHKTGIIDGAEIITDIPVVLPAADAGTLDISQYTRYFTSDEDGYGVLYQKDTSAGIKEGLYLGEASHQHSMSTDCAVNTGEQILFTALPQDFTGGTLAEGNYYLSEDITLDSTWEISGTVNLCLNGHILQYGGTAQNCVININYNASLHICDCISTGRISGGKKSGIRVIHGHLDIYGGNISDNTVEDGHGGGIYCSNSTISLYDGMISGNKASYFGSTPCGGGIYVAGTKAEFQMYGGVISENITTESTIGNTTYFGRGGGVYIGGGAVTELWDGSILNNRSSEGGGVSIYDDNSLFLMHDGIISGNISSHHGGGVCITYRNSIFEMQGGKISNNTAADDIREAGVGGGVAINGIFIMSDGIISDNNASYQAGGIGSYGSYQNNPSKIRISGSPIIKNNKTRRDNLESNLQLRSNDIITIIAPLNEGADIGVLNFREYDLSKVVTDSPFAISTAGAVGLDINDYAQYFTSDNADYGIFYQDGSIPGMPKGLYLGEGLTVTYDYAFNGGSSSTLVSAFMEKNTTLDLSSDAPNAVTATKEGWEFVGWNTDPDATEGLDTLTVGTTNVTLYAIYKKTITANFYSGNTNQKVTRDITIYNNQTEGTITSPKLADFPGWQAAGWDTDTTGYTGAVPEASDITISEDTDYYGVYQQDVTLSYDANGGTTTPASETKKRYANVHNSITYRNPVFTLAPAVSRTGYTFDGWHQGSTTGTVKRPGTEVELIGNTTFYADWRLDTDRSYVVEHYWQNVTGDGYTLIDTVPHTGTAGAEAEAEARTYTGFTENTEHPSRKASGIIAEDGSLVLKLYYDRDIYTVSFDLNGAEGTPPEAQTIRYGGTVAPVPAPVWEGYAFTGWYMNDKTGSGNRWDFTAAVEENERNQTRIVTHKEIVLYAGWRKEAVDTPNEPVQPARPTEPDTGNNNNSNNNSTTINNNVTINNSNSGTSPASGKPVPMTGDAAHLELYATAAMIAGLSYLLLEMADEQGMTEEKKRELTARLIRWAKQGGAFRRILAFMAMFLILAYYHAIGKQFSAKSIHVLEK